MLTDVEAVFDYLSLTPTDALLTAASVIVEGLEGQVEEYVRKPLVPTEFTETMTDVRIDRGGRWRPRNGPLVSIDALSVDGGALTYLTDYLWDSQGVNLGVIRPTTSLSVTYVAGLPGDDGTSPFGRQLRSRVIAKAAGILSKVAREDQAGLSELDIEGTRYRWSVGEGFTEEELKASFGSFRRRVLR